MEFKERFPDLFNSENIDEWKKRILEKNFYLTNGI